MNIAAATMSTEGTSDEGMTDQRMTARGMSAYETAAVIAKRARCADPDSSYSHLFFSEDPIHVARAKAICALCVVRDLCLSTALQREEAYGVWGGELVVDGEIKVDIPRRGRPRKVSRILVNVDEVTGIAI